MILFQSSATRLPMCCQNYSKHKLKTEQRACNMFKWTTLHIIPSRKELGLRPRELLERGPGMDSERPVL